MNSSNCFLYSSNGLVLITEMECLVRGVNWNFKYNSGSCWLIFIFSDRAMAQAAICRHFTKETLVLSQLSPCEICIGRSGTATGFSPSTVLRFSSVIIILPMAHIHRHLHCCSYRDKRARPRNLPQSSANSEIGEHWIKGYFNLTFSSLEDFNDVSMFSVTPHNSLSCCAGHWDSLRFSGAFLM